MPSVLLCRDKPGALEVRKTNRGAHLDYLAETGVVSQAGPLLDADGEMCGSIIVLDVEYRGEAEQWAAADPYAKAGLFSEVEILHWNRVIG